MAASKSPEPPGNASYSEMATGDVEAIGSHCQMSFCGQLDFLPFRCESCKGKYCLEHRSETAHSCSNKGAWARARTAAQQQQNGSNPNPTPKPTLLTHEQQCSDPSCKTLINTPLVTGVHCEKCNRSYCLKHRLAYEHSCANLTPLGARPSFTRERGLAALEALKAWGAAKRAGLPATGTTTKSTVASRVAATTQLKKSAKGDDKIAPDKRVYLYVEASADTVSSKLPKGAFFYSKEFSVGRVLDLAAKSLSVANVNNRTESEEERLRVFHVEGGRLLQFGEKLGSCVQTGNTIVLLRGVGADMAAAP